MSGGGGGQTQKTELPLSVIRGQGRGITEAERLLDNPPALFEGPRRAMLDPLQAQAQNQALGLAGGSLSGLNRTGIKTFQDILSPEFLSPESNPFLMQTADAATRPYIEQFTEQVAPQSRLGDIATGQVGGTAGAVERGLAAGRLGQAAMDTRANIFANARQNAINQQLSAAQLLPGFAQQTLMPSRIAEDIGAFRRAEDQAAIDESIQQFFEREMQGEEALNRFVSRVQPLSGFGGGTTTISGGGGGLGPIGGAATGALGGLGTAAALQSMAPAGSLFSGATTSALGPMAPGMLAGGPGLAALAALGAIGGGLAFGG